MGDIDKRKLCTTRKYSRLGTRKLYPWRKFFFQEVYVFREKNIWTSVINSKTLRSIIDRKLCRIFHWAVATRRWLKAGTMELYWSQKKFQVPDRKKCKFFWEQYEFQNEFKKYCGVLMRGSLVGNLIKMWPLEN